MEEIQQAPKVSVLIVSHNSATPLRRCLEALERSAGRETFEIVVVDNGSLDESPRLDAEFPKIQLLRLPRHFGAVKALNIGMRTATGEFIFFLPPEFEVEPETVSALAARLEAATAAIAVCPLPVTPSGKPLFRQRRLATPDDLYRHWRGGDFADWRTPDFSVGEPAVDYPEIPAMMARRQFLQGMRYIDDHYSHSWWALEVCCQIRRASKKILLLPSARIVKGFEQPVAPMQASVRALLAADSAIGARRFAGKHYGWPAGFKLKLKIMLSAFLSLFTFRDFRYHFSLLINLLDGQKLDGSQRML